MVTLQRFDDSRRPRWLMADRVDECVQAAGRDAIRSPAAYLRVCPRPEEPAWVERRYGKRSSEIDARGELAEGFPAKVRDGVERRVR